MKLERSRSEFDQLCEAAAVYWSGNTLAGGDDVIIVEAFHPDFRVVYRNLVVANALRRQVRCRLLVISGMDPVWMDSGLGIVRRPCCASS